MNRLSPRTLGRTRELRRDMTMAERKLWRELRLRRFGGLRFRRQHPLGRFVADFACLEARLVIEVDGGQHAELGPRDAERTRVLEQRGFRVLRFWNHEVMGDVAAVADRILEVLALDPHPGLPPGRGKVKAGGGEGQVLNPHPGLPPGRGKVKGADED